MAKTQMSQQQKWLSHRVNCADSSQSFVNLARFCTAVPVRFGNTSRASATSSHRSMLRVLAFWMSKRINRRVGN